MDFAHLPYHAAEGHTGMAQLTIHLLSGVPANETSELQTSSGKSVRAGNIGVSTASESSEECSIRGAVNGRQM